MRRSERDVSTLSTVLLWLFVIDLGIALGAGLYEARIVVPDWITGSGGGFAWNPEAAREDDTGRRFWVAVTTIPLTLLTLANLFAGWRAGGALRRWWGGAATIALVERAFTLGYFIPTMVRLTQTGSTAAAAASAARWAQLNNVRHLLVVAAFLAALRAFSLLYARHRGAGDAHRSPGETAWTGAGRETVSGRGRP